MKDSRDDLHPKWFIWGQQPISCRLVRVARHVGALASTGVQPVGLLARRWRTRRIFLAPVAMAPVSTLPPNFLFLNENFQRFWRQIFQIVKIRFRWIRISDEFFSKLCEPYGAENTRNDFIDDRSCPCGCHGDRWRLIFPLFVRVFCLFISVGKRQQLLALVPHPHLTWNTRGLGHPDYVEHVPLLLARRQKSIRNSN